MKRKRSWGWRPRADDYEVVRDADGLYAGTRLLRGREFLERKAELEARDAAQREKQNDRVA